LREKTIAMMEENPSLDAMYMVIEGYGIKREIFEKSHPTPQDVLILYRLINEKLQKEQEIARLKNMIKN